MIPLVTYAFGWPLTMASHRDSGTRVLDCGLLHVIPHSPSTTWIHLDICFDVTFFFNWCHGEVVILLSIEITVYPIDSPTSDLNFGSSSAQVYESMHWSRSSCWLYDGFATGISPRIHLICWTGSWLESEKNIHFIQFEIWNFYLGQAFSLRPQHHAYWKRKMDDPLFSCCQNPGVMGINDVARCDPRSSDISCMFLTRLDCSFCIYLFISHLCFLTLPVNMLFLRAYDANAPVLWPGHVVGEPGAKWSKIILNDP